MNTVKINANQTKMIAHRGVSGLERENTCAAFVAAGNRSYFGIETDVHVAGDGSFIIIHDETTDRVSGGTHCINVEQRDYAALSDVVLPDLDGLGPRCDIRIPALTDYVRICKKYEKVGVLEIKNHVPEQQLSGIIATIRSLDYLENIIFISFDWENCANLRRLLPDARIQWLTSRALTDDMLETLCANRIDLDIHYKQLSADLVACLHASGRSVNCWTVDDAQAAQALVDMGVDFITTNILEG